MPTTRPPYRCTPATWPVETTARPGTPRCSRWLACLTRCGVVGMLVVSLLVGLGGTPATAQPAPPPPLPVPTTPGTPGACAPGSLQQEECRHPSATAPPAPCIGPGCISQPDTVAPPPTGLATDQHSDAGSGEENCGIIHIGGCVTNAINAFFRGIVTDALNPLLELLSKTLLSTPTPQSLPRIGALWTTSWQLVLACYTMLVLTAGVLVMGYESVQTRHSVKEIAPRIVVGFLAAALSLWAASAAIQIANALSQAVMGEGVEATSAGHTLKNLILDSLHGGIFIILLGVVLAGMLLVLLVTYIVRVALTIILIVGAPLALMCHALPQTEGIARWWWKAFGGCLAIQLGQSLTLITAMKVFLTSGGFTPFGPTRSGLVTLLVSLALLYILIKIPFWILGSMRGGGGGRSLAASLVRGVVISKTLGLLGAHASHKQPHTPRSPRHRPHHSKKGSDRAAADPYARVRTNAKGQYLLPLTGLRRSTTGPRTRPTQTRRSAAPARRAKPRQLRLPLGDDWPENKPILGRDGQYRLPLRVERRTEPASKPSTPPHSTTSSGTQRRGRTGRQLKLPLDNPPTRTGQHRLPGNSPLRHRPATTPASTARPHPPTKPPPAGAHLRLPVDLPPPAPRSD